MINIENVTRPKGFAPFRNIKRYYHEKYVEQFLIASLKEGLIDDFESEYRLYIQTAFAKKQVFLDFVIKKGNSIGFIEVDGPQHFKYIEQFHKNGISDFIKQQNRDKIANKFCLEHGKLLRLPTTLEDNKVDKKLKLFINTLCED
jgi:hypothetical protein